MKIALKDNISTKNFRTTCGSKMLENYTPIYNAAVVDKLESAGFEIIGKLDMAEFAVGDCDSVATAVKSGEVQFALGGDERKSCARVGVTGLKPTYGAVSRYGIIANSTTPVSVIARNINDCAMALAAISGSDENDGSVILDKPFEFGNSTLSNLNGVRIGVPQDFVDSEVAKEFKSAGAEIEEFDFQFNDYAELALRVIESAETSSNLARLDGLRYGYRSESAKSLAEMYRTSRSEGFGIDVKFEIMLGALVLSSDCYDAYYRKALQVRELVKLECDKLFERFDMLLAPITNESVAAAASLAGLPAVWLQQGFQLVGKAFEESELVNAARVYESRKEAQI